MVCVEELASGRKGERELILCVVPEDGEGEVGAEEVCASFYRKNMS